MKGGYCFMHANDIVESVCDLRKRKSRCTAVYFFLHKNNYLKCSSPHPNPGSPPILFDPLLPRYALRLLTSSSAFFNIVVMLLLVAKKIERFCDSSKAKASTFPLFRIPSALRNIDSQVKGQGTKGSTSCNRPSHY